MSVSLEMSAPPHSPPANEASSQVQMLLRVLALLDHSNIPHCLLHGYEQYPKTIRSDVDLLIPAELLSDKLARILHDNRATLGARAVQWFIDGRHFIVLAGRDEENGTPVLLQLHAAARYEMAGRIFFEADEILKTRAGIMNSGCRRPILNSPACWSIASPSRMSPKTMHSD